LFDGYLNFRARHLRADRVGQPRQLRSRPRPLRRRHQPPAGPPSVPGADNSFERELRSWLAPDLLLLEDLALAIPPARSRKDLIRPR